MDCCAVQVSLVFELDRDHGESLAFSVKIQRMRVGQKLDVAIAGYLMIR
jgi:hypothetical protein